MKPLAIVTMALLGIASLGVIVWMGQYRAVGLVEAPKEAEKTAVVDELPLPKNPPYGKAEFNVLEHDFGIRHVGARDRHLFKIQNIGAGMLSFKLGKPSCQCTVGEIYRDAVEGKPTETISADQVVDVAPSETVNILLKWEMKVLTPKFRQYVPLVTTDPDRRQVELVVSGVVDDPIRILPGTLWELGEMSRTEPSTAEGTIYSTVFKNFEVTEVPREGGHVKVEVIRIDPETVPQNDVKSAFAIKFKAGPDVPVGMFRENVQLKVVTPEEVIDAKPEAGGSPASAQAEPEKTASNELIREIFVTGRRSGPIELRQVSKNASLNMASNRLVMGSFPASEGKKATVTMVIKGFENPLELKGFEPADGPIRVKLLGPGKINLGKAKSYEFEVEVVPGPAGKFTEDNPASVTLKLNHPDAPDFKLLVDYTSTR